MSCNNKEEEYNVFQYIYKIKLSLWFFRTIGESVFRQLVLGFGQHVGY